MLHPIGSKLSIAVFMVMTSIFSYANRALPKAPVDQRSVAYYQSAHGEAVISESSTAGPEYVPGEVVVKLRTPIPQEKLENRIRVASLGAEFDAVLEQYGARETSLVFPRRPNYVRRSTYALRYRQLYGSSGLSNVVRVRLAPGADVKAAVGDLGRLAQVEYAEPNYLYHSQSITNDPYLVSEGSWGQPYSDLWGLHKVFAPGAWDTSTGAGVLVAVVDSGCDTGHPDLADNIWTNRGEVPDNGLDDDQNGFIDDVTGWDFAYADNDVSDPVGHGTHIAGTIAAVGNNGIGIVGMAWGARVMAVRGLDDFGNGTEDALASGIVYAVENGANVINMSWGGGNRSRLIEDALMLAYSMKVTPVAAAGNNSAWASLVYPANSRYVITVGSSDRWDRRSTFSNYGTSLDVLAPGGDSYDGTSIQLFRNILSLRSRTLNEIWDDPEFTIGQDYLRAYGTSMAAPHVAGLAALILQRFPSAGPEEVRQIVRRSADDVPGTQTAPGWDLMTGYGRINALVASRATEFGSARIFSPMPEITTSDDAIPIRITAAAPDFSDYVLEYGDENEWYPLVSSASPVVHQDILNWDAESVPDGRYYVRLRVKNQHGEEFHDRTVVTLDRVAISAPSPNAAYRPGRIISIEGMAAGGGFSSYEIQYQSHASSVWRTEGIVLANSGTKKVRNGILATWDTRIVAQPGFYRVRLVVKRKNLADIVTEIHVIIDPTIHPGWPQNVGSLPVQIIGLPGTLAYLHNVTAADIDRDGEIEIPVAYGDEVKVFRSDGTMASGWPQKINLLNPNTHIQVGPVIGDIDGDGTLEVAATTNSFDLFVWNYEGKRLSGFPARGEALAIADINHDGRGELVAFVGASLTVLDSGGKHMNGWPVSLGQGPAQVLSTSIGDLDGDGDAEIVALVRVGSDVDARVFSHDGKLLPGWPVGAGGYYLTNPPAVLCDIDGDGMQEIFVGTSPDTIAALRMDGGPLAGWPVRIAHISSITGLSAGDITGDGLAEIYVGGRGQDISYSDAYCVLRGDGSILPGWPVLETGPLATLGAGSAAIVDIDGDGRRELIVGGGAPYWPSLPRTYPENIMPFSLHAFHADGREVTGFPKASSDFDPAWGSTPAVLDFDHDGLLEIAWLNKSGDVYLWDTSGPARVESSDWSVHEHDPGHSNDSIHPAQLHLSLPALGAGTAGTFRGSGPIHVGYATGTFEPAGSVHGTAVFSLDQNNATVSEAAVPAVEPTAHASVFVDCRRGEPGIPDRTDGGFVDITTAIAIVNPGPIAAHATFTLKNGDGDILSVGHGTIAGGAHAATLIDQLNLVAPDFAMPEDFFTTTRFGSLEVAGDLPLSVAAFRLTTNQRGETLLTTMPVTDLTIPPGNDPLYFPQFVDGGGYTTTLFLKNTSDVIATGRLSVYDDNGQPLAVGQAGGTVDSAFAYVIPPHGTAVFQTAGIPVQAIAGSVQVVPAADSRCPAGALVFSFTQAGIRVTESGVPAGTPTTHAHVFVDTSGNHNSGLALVSTGGAGAEVSVRAFQVDGKTPAGLIIRTITLKPNEHHAAFIGQLIRELPDDFRGILDLTSTGPIAALTVRSTYNARGEYLLTMYPVADLTKPAPSTLIFPQIVAGGGYGTEFILMGDKHPMAGILSFFNEIGALLGIGR